MGENGAGKTTLLRIVAGLLPASGGHVEVHGRLGYCPQEPQVHAALTVAQNLEWFAAAYRLKGPGPAGALLERLAFEQYRHALVRDLSGGTRQKLNLVLALMHAPTVLLLDEPYQRFDWETYQRFWALADDSRRAGQTIANVPAGSRPGGGTAASGASKTAVSVIVISAIRTAGSFRIGSRPIVRALRIAPVTARGVGPRGWGAPQDSERRARTAQSGHIGESDSLEDDRGTMVAPGYGSVV